jgi:hypothetical protein
MSTSQAVTSDAATGLRPVAKPLPGNGYDLSMVQLDPNVPLEDHRGALATVQGWFRQAGLSTDEARLLIDRFNAAVDPYSRPAARPDGPRPYGTDRLAKEADDYLRVRWGRDYGRNMGLVEVAIERLGGEALEEFLRSSGLRFDPFVLRTLAEAAQRSGWSPGSGQATASAVGTR